MTLEESWEVIPMMEEMIGQIEEQQELLAEVYQELKEKDEEMVECWNRIQELQQLNKELQTQLSVLPNIEEMLSLMEKQNFRIQEMKIENQQWRKLSEALTKENSQLQIQNVELLKLNNK